MTRRPTAAQVTGALDFYEAMAPEEKKREPELALDRPLNPIDRGPTYSEQYRHECEVREVRAMTPERREAFLQLVAEKRGQAAAERIRREV